ncbi:MAG: chloride channel protein, partial [Clostridia bacterium]|nr:chloride channel protein [Clostridia bacterium]
MTKTLYNRIKHLLLPCLAFSVITGVLSALIITLFKILAEWVIHFSFTIYGTVRENPVFLPLLILGVAAIGLAASILLSLSHGCKGGGIPTSVAAIRGIVRFHWISSLLLLPLSALMTFLAGLPLGTEGPCVQMGTAIGDGVVHCVGKEKHKGWRRYVMTGGASAGFSLATGAPITAILFSMEELHKRFSPLLLTIATSSVI